MTFQEIIHGRLEVFFARIRNEPGFEATEKQKLGDPPIGYDDETLKGQIRGRLNRYLLGFSEILATDIQRSDLGEGTAFGDLAKAIVKRSCLKKVGGKCQNTVPLYRKLVDEIL